VNGLSNPTAQAVDNVLIYIFGSSLLLLFGITVTTVYFVIKYRRSKCPEPTSECHGNWLLEIIWTVLPTLIVLTMFWYGWTNYIGLTRVPEGAMEIKGTARMWSWMFEYPNGRRTNKIYVPVGTPVQMKLNSVDVLHSFFIPAFRIKKDTVPGMETYVWFEATEAGNYDVFCAEYCGVGHADMMTQVVALTPEDYAVWEREQEPAGDPRGLVVINEQGCTGCHSLDGSDGIGPSLFELAGKTRQVVKDGQTIEIPIDADYLIRALREPDAEIVAGYEGMMPPYDDSIISDADAQAVADYLLGKTGAAAPQINADQVLEENGCTGCHSLDGSDGIAPSLFELAGKTRQVEKDGQTLEIPIDAAYLRRAVREPNSELVAGYAPMMPAYDSDTISDAQLQAVINKLLDIKTETAAAPGPDGAELVEMNGCLGCHSTDGSADIAPSFKGLGSREVTIERNGEELTLKVDADYLRRALLEPNADLVKDYSPMMPAADYLSKEEIDAIIEYLQKQ